MNKMGLLCNTITHLFPISYESWIVLSQKLMLFFPQIISFYLLCIPRCFHRFCEPSLLSWSMPESWVSECNCRVRLRSSDPVTWENQNDPRPERRLLLSCNCISYINMSSFYSAVQWSVLGWNIQKSAYEWMYRFCLLSRHSPFWVLL